MGSTLRLALKNLDGDVEYNTFLFTADGGIAIKYINKSGAPTIKGNIAELSSSFVDSVNIIVSDDLDPIGIFYETGIADGEKTWIVVTGKAYVLIEDGTTATKGYWVRVSETQAGRADITNAAPPGGTIGALESHLHECGHCSEDVVSDIDKLALINLHFL